MARYRSARGSGARCALRCGVALAAVFVLAASGRAQIASPFGPPRTFPEQDDEQRELAVERDRLFAPRWRLAGGPHIKAAFRDAVRTAAAATVSVRADGEQIALGGVVAADGWILTKASQLRGDLTCVLADGRELEAFVVAEDGTRDLALLKVEAQALPTLDLTYRPAWTVGSWVATTSVDRDPAAVGVVSVAPRPIPPKPGVLGVRFNDDNQPVVVEVLRRSAAEQAGVKIDDLIVSVDGDAIGTADAAIRRIRARNAGDEVTLGVQRGEEQLTLHAELSADFPGTMRGRNEFQNHMGGRLSKRRFGFPLAVQHDTVLRPADCGGPVVDLDGHVVGFNIARSGRTESYLLPAAEVASTVSALKARGLAASAPSP